MTEPKYTLGEWLDKLEDQLIGINDQLSTLNELIEQMVAAIQTSSE